MDTIKLTKRAASKRGHANHGWLDSKHTFSFADYYDPDNMGFKSLRVINDDKIAPFRGFDTHPHRNMEIFTYVISGELEHKDSMGNGRIIKAGEFQYMSAGSGVKHSEFNPSDQETHMLQIWIQPNETGGEPRYAELDTQSLNDENGLTLFASADGRNGSVQIRQDAEIYFGHTSASQQIRLQSPNYDSHWIHVINGEVKVGEVTLTAGDGLAIEEASDGYEIITPKESKFILFQLK